MAVRTLVLWCRDWPVVAAGGAPSEPAAVVAANRVVACTPAARAAGVAVGQRRREAQGRCPHLAVFEPDDARDARAFEAVVRAVETFTPRLEVAVPGRCAFVTRGPSRYFGGDDALAARVHDAVDVVVTERGWPGSARVGIADSPFAATLAARAAHPTPIHPSRATRVVEVGETAAFLAPRPVAALGRPELADVLQRLGLPTLGDLAALPAADVVARFGAEGLGAHRLAAGLDEHPPDSREPPPDLALVTELDPPADRVDIVAFVAKALADDLFDGLAERGLSCTRVLVTAETEHGERNERLWRHDGAFTAGAVTDRVRWQLEGWLHGPVAHQPTAGIVRLALAPDEVVPALGRQLGFWGGETDEARRAARALARVSGLLGPESVCVPERRGGRGPGEQLVLVPATAVDLAADRSGVRTVAASPPWPGRVPPPSPARVHAEPEPVEVLDGHGEPVEVTGRGLATAAPARVRFGGGATGDVTAWAGPWPVDERWWDPPAHRRRARIQVVLAGGNAHLLGIEGGRWHIEATYD